MDCYILKMLFDVTKDIYGKTHVIAKMHSYRAIKESLPDLPEDQFREQITMLRNKGYIETFDITENNGVIDGSLRIMPSGVAAYYQSLSCDD